MEKRTRQKYVNAAAVPRPSKFIGRFRSLVEWKSIPDTCTINGSENNKLGSRSPRVYDRATTGVQSIRHDGLNDVQTVAFLHENHFIFGTSLFPSLFRLSGQI